MKEVEFLALSDSERDYLVSYAVLGWENPTRRRERLGNEGKLAPRAIPHFTQDMASCWKVVDRIRFLTGPDYEMEFRLRSTSKGWAARFFEMEEGVTAFERFGEGRAMILPLAICIAALRFVGEMEAL